MDPKAAWAASTNFLVFGAGDAGIANALLSLGLDRTLVVVRNQRQWDSLCARHPNLGKHVVCSGARKTVRNNNGDVLVLSGAYVRALANRRNWRHARQIAWAPRWSLFACAAALFCLLHVLMGQLRWSGTVRLGPSARRLLVFDVLRRKPSEHARHYLPHATGISGFLHRLRGQAVGHCVLRWFESLPDLPAGEDLDLLIPDDAFEVVLEMLAEGPGVQPVDVYTATGLPGSDYAGMPYFPPHLAEEILANARPQGDLCMVPSARHHFLSLAYHVLYHKGDRSGLPSIGLGQRSRPDHAYAGILRKLAENLAIQVEISLDDLDDYLDRNSWRPPADMLARLAHRNRWLKHALARQPRAPEDPGMGVFVVRREGLRDGGVARIASLIEHHGFQIVATKILAECESRYAATLIRGGNWGRGPWKTSGGPPAAAIVVYDPEPVKPTAWQRREFPRLTNARFLIKKQIRDEFNRHRPDAERCNVLHSSDNGHEALDYLHILMPDAIDEIRARVRRIRSAYTTPEPVLKAITRHGRRAKIELIELGGQTVVKKTFKPHQEHYGHNEAEALRNLSPRVAAVPPLLGADRYSVIMPYYDDVLRYRRSSGKLFPLKTAKEAIRALQDIYEAGYAMIDAHVENVLVDRDTGLKLVDFEFAHRYDRTPTTFQQSYDIAGCPPDFTGNLPDGGASSYAKGWQPFVGLSLDSLLHDPEWLQHLKRAAYYLIHWHRFIPRRLRSCYRYCRDSIHSRMIRRPSRPLAPPNASRKKAA